MDDSNQDTVRSVSELIKRTDDEIENADEDIGDGFQQHNSSRFSVQNELVRRGFPAFDRHDSQAPESIVGKSESKENLETEPTKPKILCTKKLKQEIATVCVLATIIIVGVTLIYHFYHKQLYTVELGRRIFFTEDMRQLKVVNMQQEEVLHGKLGLDIPEYHLPYDCSVEANKGVEMCMLWKKEAILNITYYEDQEHNVACYNVEWASLKETIKPHDCFQFSGGHWYGGALMRQWPLEKEAFGKRAVVPGYLHSEESFGPVLERYWLSSLGVAIFVEDNSPLHMSINASEVEEQFCLYGDFDDSVFVRPPGALPRLNYTICVGEDALSIDNYMFTQFGTPPGDLADESILRRPVWSTWAAHHTNIDQQTVLSMAHTVANYSSRSLFIIDSGWQKAIGDLDFDIERFPNASGMFQTLHSLGFEVGLTIQPWISTDSSNFPTAVVNDYLVQDAGGKAPGVSPFWLGPMTDEWKQGFAASVDVHTAAMQWWGDKLNTLNEKYGPLHFRLEGGETEMLPYHAHYHLGYQNPSKYVTRLNQQLYNIADGNTNTLVRAAYGSQDMALVVSVSEGDSRWSALRDVVPAVLNLGVIGYPYVMPDAVGGNAYSGEPSKELFIRWLQLTTFMPIMHLSIPPTRYDDETRQLARTMIELHEHTLGPILIGLAKDAAEDLVPFIRPLWWTDQAQNVTYEIDDQFFLGPDILVAPILVDSARSRDVYFPSGLWEQQTANGKTYQGPGWVHNMPCSLYDILYFFKKSANDIEDMDTVIKVTYNRTMDERLI